MIRGIIFFLALWAVVTGGINVVRSLTGKEMLDTIKCVVYGLMTALVAFALIVTMVILF
jgi:hypothetical protein